MVTDNQIETPRRAVGKSGVFLRAQFELIPGITRDWLNGVHMASRGASGFAMRARSWAKSPADGGGELRGAGEN
jgi:hypothetical protein